MKTVFDHTSIGYLELLETISKEAICQERLAVLEEGATSVIELGTLTAYDLQKMRRALVLIQEVAGSVTPINVVN